MFSCSGTSALDALSLSSLSVQSFAAHFEARVSHFDEVEHVEGGAALVGSLREPQAQVEYLLAAEQTHVLLPFSEINVTIRIRVTLSK